MQERKQIGILIGLVMSVSLLTVFFTALFVALSYQAVSGRMIFCMAAGVFTAGTCFAGTFVGMKHLSDRKIQKLTDYLEKINMGKAGVLMPSGEDALSRLQDEIYKTVTMLCQTRDEALRAKSYYAKNLSNIAHQIKTPITAISLAVQMKQDKPEEQQEQICRQVTRLTHLEEALLLLSRIDAGTLMFRKESVDVFTLLTMAADNLQELFLQAHVDISIPELGEKTVYADFDWTMEAVMNLLKNCMEHTPPGGCVYCQYEQNPLYTQIMIWDLGEGFVKEDIPHLFERFYRGQNAANGGIGIGLALAKEIVESQNGTIRAENRAEGGACFEIRFYCH